MATPCSLLGPTCGTTTRTAYLGRHFNGALSAGGFGLFTHNADAKSASARARNCTSEHTIELRALRCDGRPLTAPTSRRAAPAWPRLLTLTAALPHRTCVDVLNFRGNGPEDARLLPLPPRTSSDPPRILALYVDYAPAPASPPPTTMAWPLPKNAASSGHEATPHIPHHRRMHAAIISLNLAAASSAPSTLLATARDMLHGWSPSDEPAPTAAAPSSASSGSPPAAVLAAAARGGVRVGRTHRLEPASPAVANLSAIEKNWVPFTIDASGDVYLQQWLDDGHGVSVTYRLDVTSGVMLERYESQLPSSVAAASMAADAAHPAVTEGTMGVRRGGVLQRAMGAAPHAAISGGTPALRLNSTHMLAIGHTMTWACNLPEVRAKGKLARARCLKRHRWRSYAMFGYTFDAFPPFKLRSVSHEFRLRVPGAAPPLSTPRRRLPDVPAAEPTTGAYGDNFYPGDRDVLRPPPPVRAIHIRLRGAEGKAQFPIGLSWADHRSQRGHGYEDGSSIGGARCVLLSWGHDDVESYVSAIPLPTLLGPGMSVRL